MNRNVQTLLGMIALVSTTTFAAELKYSITPDFFEQNPDHQPLGPRTAHGTSSRLIGHGQEPYRAALGR